jgi:hypothetical protein
VSASYKNLRVARPACWARFTIEGDLGYPEEVKVRVRYFALDQLGNTAELVLDQTGGLKDAKSFPNFIGYVHGEQELIR